jgi:hypothetical protein
MATNDHRGTHDLGGVEPLASQPIDRSEHELTQFDKSVDALVNLLSRPPGRIIRVDELRRAIEALPPDKYLSLPYYEKWLAATTALLIEKGVLTRDEIDRRCAAIRAEMGK